MEPLLHQGLGHCGSFLIFSRDSLQILCEDVCKNQDILSSIWPVKSMARISFGRVACIEL